MRGTRARIEIYATGRFMLSPHKQPSTASPRFKAIYARGLTSQAVNLTHTPHWPECLMYYEGNACSDRNLCNWQGDVVLGPGAHVRCSGKGRKERSTPLRKDSVHALRTWLAERAGEDDEPLFVSNRGERLSRDAVERIVRKYVNVASDNCRTLKTKRVSPHVLRHYIECMTMSGNQATGTILIREYSFVGEHPQPITRHSLRRATGC